MLLRIIWLCIYFKSKQRRQNERIYAHRDSYKQAGSRQLPVCTLQMFNYITYLNQPKPVLFIVQLSWLRHKTFSLLLHTILFRLDIPRIHSLYSFPLQCLSTFMRIQKLLQYIKF